VAGPAPGGPATRVPAPGGPAAVGARAGGPYAPMAGGPPPGPGPGPGAPSRTPLLVVAALLVLATIGAVAALVANGGDDDTGGRIATTSLPGPTTTATGPATTGGTTPTTAATTTTRPSTTTTAPRPVPLDVVAAGAPAEAAGGNDACGNPTSFTAANMVDGVHETAWRMDGDGTGTTLTFDLGGARRVLEVGLVPGYAKVDPCDGVDRFAQNRRPTSVTWVFDDGTTVSQQLADAPDMQRVNVDVESTTVQLRIEGVTGDPERDFTAISEVALAGV
jgi:hypothetical protein